MVQEVSFLTLHDIISRAIDELMAEEIDEESAYDSREYVDTGVAAGANEEGKIRYAGKTSDTVQVPPVIPTTSPPFDDGKYLDTGVTGADEEVAN
jgi:hypothetical protein